MTHVSGCERFATKPFEDFGDIKVNLLEHICKKNLKINYTSLLSLQTHDLIFATLDQIDDPILNTSKFMKFP